MTQRDINSRVQRKVKGHALTTFTPRNKVWKKVTTFTIPA